MKNKPHTVAVFIAAALLTGSIDLCAQNVTALSGTGSNTCSAGNAGADNTSVGCGAGQSVNANESKNTFLGFQAGNVNGTGDNTGSGSSNTFAGWRAGVGNTTGGENVFIGRSAGFSNVSSFASTYVGTYAGYSGTTGSNTCVGYYAGYNNTGTPNTFIGNYSGYSNTSGVSNTATGYYSGHFNVTGSYNSSFGYEAGRGTSTNSFSNTAFFGYRAGYSTTTGSDNTAIGNSAGSSITTGSDNTFLGYSANTGTGSLSNCAAIGANTTVRISDNMILGDNNTKVGINLSNDATGALSVLSVGGNGNALYETYSYNSNSSSDGVNGIRGECATPSFSSNHAIAILGLITCGTGYSYGTYGSSYNATTSAGRAYGAYGVAGNASAGFNYGVYGNLAGSRNGTGVYGTIAGADYTVPGQYAGVFNGQIRTTNDSPEKPTGGAWIGYSDARLKTNIAPFKDGLAVLRKIDPVTYQFNGIGDLPTQATHIGVIAQDIKKAAPYCVSTGKLVINNNDAGKFADDIVETLPADSSGVAHAIVKVNTYTYDGLVYVLINSVKQLDSTVASLQEQLKTATQNSTAGVRPEQNNVTDVHQITLSNEGSVVLYQNDPNPFNGNTTIRYFIPDNLAGNAVMTFYDAFGAEINRVEIKAAGDGKIEIDAANLSSGVYTYSLTVNGKIYDTKKMLRTK